MRTISIITVVTVLAIAIAGLAGTGTANAAHVGAAIDTPEQFEIGRASPVQLTLRSEDGGAPIADAAVTFYTDASFAGVSGQVELARVVTDEAGIAVFEYEPRTASVHELRAEYLISGESEPEVVTTSVSVAGASQLYQSAAGIQIPGLNVWLIIAIVSSVWFLLFSVAVRVFAIASAGPPVRGVTS